ncbi:hypothetical protein EB061_09485 [bacterium]|nr:hypothetical protein [bacterium]
MNIHEYQAKSLLKRFKVPVSEGVLVEGSRDGITYKTPDQIALEATRAAEKLKARRPWWPQVRSGLGSCR